VIARILLPARASNNAGRDASWRFAAATLRVGTVLPAHGRTTLRGPYREAFASFAQPPVWCIEMEKWPYHTQDWKDWLKFKRANANPPLPDTAEWQPFLAAHR
jgi:hypothetical protein